MGRYRDCLRLNRRVASLALSRAWLTSRDVAASYDHLAPGYEENWLRHLRPVTDTLLGQIPAAQRGPILDLGCGTGYSTEQLAKRHLDALILAQDISAGMLDIAKAKHLPERVSLHQSDMLDFMKTQPNESASLVVSAWAIGYSHPRDVLKEAFRALQPGGHVAFVVNLMNTLRPVYIAFRETMQRHSDKLRSLAWPRFPASWTALEKQSCAIGFTTRMSDSGTFQVRAPGEASLEWLLKTGLLAGFDAMLPLADDPEIAAFFEQRLALQNEPLEHHHISAILQKS